VSTSIEKFGIARTVHLSVVARIKIFYYLHKEVSTSKIMNLASAESPSAKFPFLDGHVGYLILVAN